MRGAPPASCAAALRYEIAFIGCAQPPFGQAPPVGVLDIFAGLGLVQLVARARATQGMLRGASAKLLLSPATGACGVDSAHGRGVDGGCIAVAPPRYYYCQ